MTHDRIISVVGLGYVGLPVAIAFARNDWKVVAFDTNLKRIDALKQGIDWTGEVNTAELFVDSLLFTNDPEQLANADFHIVTVPTPITDTK